MSTTLQQIFAPVPLPTRAQPIHIGGDPKGINILYCVGNSVVTRNSQDISKAELYQQHSHNPTVARYAPSGFYIASADASGKVRIWDTTQAEHILKNEFHLLGGPIQDMAWSDDSKRIAVVGQGKEKFGAVVFSDTGASVGEISGHSKTINTVDLKQTRPYRLITGSEDLALNFFEGPPFKFKKAFKEHQRFINATRFAPNGEKFISVSSDKSCFIFDGKTGDKIGQLDAAEGHKSGVYGAAWSPDSAQVLTVSADKTAKLWDAESYKCLATFTLGTDTEDQQLGCIWNGANGEVVTVALSGFLNILDLSNPDKPKKVVRGHNKRITALGYDRSRNAIYSADFEGRLLEWDGTSAATEMFSGPKHATQISATVVSGDNLYTISMDDTVKISSISNRTFGDSIALDMQPQGLAVVGDVAVVVGANQLVVLKGSKIASRTTLKYDATTAVSINPDGNEVAVGGKDQKVHVYSLNSSAGSLDAKYDLGEHRGEVTSLSYSPDGVHLAAGDSNREVIAWKGQTRVTSGWVFHTTSVNAVAWSPDNVHIASVGTDSNLIVWNVAAPTQRIVTKNAHYGGAIQALWMNESTVLTAGQDCSLKAWTVKF